MSLTWPRWPLLLASVLTAGSSLAAEKLSPLSPSAVMQLRAREPSRVTESLASLKEQKPRLGLSERDDFQLSGAHTDRFGITHAHFEQLHQGVPVWGAMAITHLDASGLSLPATVEALRPNIRLDVNPRVDTADALALATLELAPRGLLSAAPTARLVVYPETQRVNLAPEKPYAALNAADFQQEVVGYRLAWHVHTELDNPEDGIAHTDFLLDARSGEVLKQWNSLQTAEALGTGKSQYSGQVPLNVWQNKDGLYELRDTTRSYGEGLRTFDVANVAVQNGTPATPKLYTDADNTWGDGQNYVAGGPTFDSDNGQTAAVDAHYGLQMTWDYYQKIHGRWGIDDKGTPTYNRVHVGVRFNNAFWSNDCFCMSYGDGSYPSSATGFKSMAALDVSAHELSHGVMSETARLIYAGESGGLNEANSDIFGAMTEFWVRNGRGDRIGDTGSDWDMGEDLNPSRPLRYMYKPSKDTVSADAWYPGIENIDVHWSSGPMNRAFYFLAQGAQTTETPNDYSSPYLPGGMVGIGNDKAAAIWYRAITVYLYPSANYLAARTATLQSAADIFGASSNEYRAVRNAFAAVNVGYTAGTYDDRTPPSARASVSGSAPMLQLQAEASDNVGVSRVEFYVDGAAVGTDTTLPFSVVLDATTVSNGAHLLSVVAYDAAGNVSASDPYTFNVANPFTQLLKDPGFEKGGEGWEADPRGNINFPVNSGARTGRGYVWLNGYGTVHIDNLYQDVSIPASATSASLTFYLNLTTQETATTANDTLVVQVRNTSGEVLETLATWSNLDTNLGWVQRSFNLSAYAGQTVRIYLEGTENATLATSFRLDDFTLRVIDGGDTEAPAVGARVTLSGSKVGLFADVSDKGHVSAVEFFLDGTSVGTAATSFAQVVDISLLSNGTHTLVAKALDESGNEGMSAPVTFFVDVSRKQLVLNPSFEDATAAGQALWPVTTTRSGSAGFLNNTSFARTGSRSFVLFNNPGPNKSSTRQTVTIPADATSAVYTFWVRLFSGGFTDGQVHHTFVAKLRDSSGVDLQTLKTLTNLDDSGAKYFEYRYDLSAYKGQTLQLFFEADMLEPAQVVGGRTQFFIDDVTLYTSSIPDTVAPAVTASINGSYGTVQLKASVSDTGWTSLLEFYVDGTLVTSRTNPNGSYTVPFDTTGLANGPHQYVVRAVDTAGNESFATVQFVIHNSTVEDVGAPNVSVGTEGLFETTVLTAQATDDTGVTAVEFYVDGAFKGRALAPPYQLPFNPIPLSVGEHTLKVVAYDAYGHASEATTTFVREAVTVAIGTPRIGVPVGGSASFTASVAKVVDTSVTWAVLEGPTCGAVDRASGAYSAPLTPALCHVSATSTVDTSASGLAAIKVFTADINGDGLVDGEDMAHVARTYGTTDTEPTYSADTDFDGSSSVDNTDVTLFVSQFGR